MMSHQPTTTPHKHAEQIKAWADGAKIQYHDGIRWCDVPIPTWRIDIDYRVKPTPKRTKRYRRWVARPTHDYIVNTVSEGDVSQPETVQSSLSFVRWIDNEWQEGIEV